MEQERMPVEVPGITVTVPQYMREIVAEITHLARRSPDISQRSGVSARMSVANYETLISNAVKRALRLGEKHAVPRISDLPALIASTLGKLEFETLGEVQEDRIIEKLINGAVVATFNRYFSVRDFDDLILAFENGLTVEASDLQPAMRYVHQVAHIESLRRATQRLGATGDPALVAAAVEFVLEGLHLNRRVNKERATGGGAARYRS
jgi:magnesium chelatase subunit I